MKLTEKITIIIGVLLVGIFVTGLAWTEFGGEILKIDSSKNEANEWAKESLRIGREQKARMNRPRTMKQILKGL